MCLQEMRECGTLYELCSCKLVERARIQMFACPYPRKKGVEYRNGAGFHLSRSRGTQRHLDIRFDVRTCAVLGVDT